MSVPSRKLTRETFATLLQTTLSGAQIVHSDQPITLDGQSPAVVVASGGTERTQATFGGTKATFYLDVYVFVLATDDGDDLLDTLEAELAETVTQNQRGALWSAISYDGRSKTEFLKTLDGKQYKSELIPLRFTSTF